MKSQKTVQMVEIALMSAVLCVVSPFTVPVPMSPVPLSLATFAVYLAVVLLGAKKSTICVLVYLLLGAMGLPVFSGFSGGIGVLFGPTGGYLLGYAACAAVAGWLLKNRTHRKETAGRRCYVRTVFALSFGTVVCYILGTGWFRAVMKGSYTFTQALLVCVVPYLLFDMVKILAAAALAAPVRRILRNRG